MGRFWESHRSSLLDSIVATIVKGAASMDGNAQHIEEATETAQQQKPTGLNPTESDALARWRKHVYLQDLPADIGPARKLLEEYSRVPPDEVDNHIHRVVGAP